MECVDVFTPEVEKRFDHNVALSGLGDRVVKHKGYSQDVLRTLPYESFDFVYIDGCHLASCVLTDAVLSWDLLRPGGVMVFDDYRLKPNAPAYERPGQAIDAFLEAFADRVALRHKGFQVVVVKTQGRSKETLVGKPLAHDEERLRALRARSQQESDAEARSSER